jgi:hypothetical protein
LQLREKKVILRFAAVAFSCAEKTLKNNSQFVSGKHDPKRAANLANGLDALYEQNGLLALMEGSQRRLFFEQQLDHEKDALANAEVDMKVTRANWPDHSERSGPSGD